VIVPVEHVVILSLLLFLIGIMGVLFRRNAIIIFMSIELMLNAVLVMTLAAAEVSVGLAIIVALYRNRQTINIDEINLMRG